jgi:hypothetical protein
MLDLERFARAYHIEPFWSYDRPGGGLLIANGTGVMLAAMDEIPSLSWCADVTGLKRDTRRLVQWRGFAQVVKHSCTHVAATLVCFVDKTDPLRDLLAEFDPDRLAVYSNESLHDTAQREWPEFVDRANTQARLSRAQSGREAAPGPDQWEAADRTAAALRPATAR